MKHIILFTFFFLLLSCTGRQNAQCIETGGEGFQASVSTDLRCDKIIKVKRGGHNLSNPRSGHTEQMRGPRSVLKIGQF